MAEGDTDCMIDGSSNYADISNLQYSAETGKFSGSIVTNQCNAVMSTPERGSSATCVEVVRLHTYSLEHAFNTSAKSQGGNATTNKYVMLVLCFVLLSHKTYSSFPYQVE